MLTSNPTIFPTEISLYISGSILQRLAGTDAKYRLNTCPVVYDSAAKADVFAAVKQRVRQFADRAEPRTGYRCHGSIDVMAPWLSQRAMRYQVELWLDAMPHGTRRFVDHPALPFAPNDHDALMSFLRGYARPFCKA